MTKHKLTDIVSTGSLAEISKSRLNSFFATSTGKKTKTKAKCADKCNTIKSSSKTSCSSSSSSSSSSSTKCKTKCRKPKCSSSTYTTTTSGTCGTSSSTSSSSDSWKCNPYAGCTAYCPSTGCSTSSSSSKCSSSSSSCKPCKPKCGAWDLKCTTYKSMNGTVLIPGPPGPSSGTLANFSGINNTGGNSSTVNFTTGNMNYVSITIGTTVNAYDTFTFVLAGKYLFQYNVTVGASGSVRLSGTINGISSTTFGVQTMGGAGSYGCSVIQDVIVGDSVSLSFGASLAWTFGSLTIIKL